MEILDKKRRNLVQSVFIIDTINEVMQVETEKQFSVGVDVDEKAIISASSRFSSLNSVCRNLPPIKRISEREVR